MPTPRLAFILTTVTAIVGCAGPRVHPAEPLRRSGDEIVACGQFFHTGTPVVLWMDPGGYDAYRTERRFVPWDKAGYEPTKSDEKAIALNGPARYGIRRANLDDATFERIRGGGWDLPTLQQHIDQLVYHYDVCGISRSCFETLQDERGLSVHFMIDIDGTIYQTLDVKEKAWHATRSNDRSIGIEIANMGANQNLSLVSQWYSRDADGNVRITIPARLGDGGVRTRGKVFHPAKNEPIGGVIQGVLVRQYDFTPEQYAALAKLTATICTIFPKITCDAPREPNGKVINHVLTDAQWANYHGLLGHFHLDKNKLDPGPAFDWESVVARANELMSAARNDQSPRAQIPARPSRNQTTTVVGAAKFE